MNYVCNKNCAHHYLDMQVIIVFQYITAHEMENQQVPWHHVLLDPLEGHLVLWVPTDRRK